MLYVPEALFENHDPLERLALVVECSTLSAQRCVLNVECSTKAPLLRWLSAGPLLR